MSDTKETMTVPAVNSIFQRPASSSEVSEAIATVEEAFGAAHVQPAQSKNPISELHNIWCFPDMKNIICSLMKDPAVWDAIRNNPAVNAVVERFVIADTGHRSINTMESSPTQTEPSSAQRHVLHWVYEAVEGLLKVTLEIMEQLVFLLKLLKFSIENSPSFPEQSTTLGSDEAPKSIVLSTIVVYAAIVVIRLANFVATSRAVNK